MGLPVSIATRGHYAAPRDERRPPVLALAFGIAAIAALGVTGPSLACRIMSDAGAVKVTVSKELTDVRSRLGIPAPTEFRQSNTDDYVPQVTRIIRFPADEL